MKSDEIELVVIGGSGTYPRPGGACNSYLIRSDRTKVLIDLGPGSLSRLFQWEKPETLDAVFISHMHPDHFIDIFPLRYYLQFSAAKNRLPLKVFAPPGSKDRLMPVFSDRNIDGFDQVFDWNELRADGKITVNEFNVSPQEVPHLPPTYSLSVVRGGDKIFYTSDTAYDEIIAELAGGASLFLCEASLSRDANGNVAHLNGYQAGKLAAMAGVKHLILTHLWPHFDADEIKSDAEQEFDGPIDLAEDGRVFTV